MYDYIVVKLKSMLHEIPGSFHVKNELMSKIECRGTYKQTAHELQEIDVQTYRCSYKKDQQIRFSKVSSLTQTSLKPPLLLKICFAYCYLIWMFDHLVCRMMYVKSLTLEGCFHIHLLKEESFSVLTFNKRLRCVRTSLMLRHRN